MDTPESQLAVITGASTAIGFEFARLYAQDRFDLIIAADEPTIHSAARELGEMGVRCKAVQCGLATPAHVSQLTSAIAGRPVDALLAVAGLGSGKALPDRGPDAALRDIQAKIDGMVRLIFEVARGMRRRGKGRIVIIGSTAGLMPDIFQAVYNCSKAFLDSFSDALSNELKDAGVTVTCLMAGATESDFYPGADVPDTKLGSRVAGRASPVGAGNRLHAVMHGVESRKFTQ
jgi:short-subunit dehydrogenase